VEPRARTATDMATGAGAAGATAGAETPTIPEQQRRRSGTRSGASWMSRRGPGVQPYLARRPGSSHHSRPLPHPGALNPRP
jgi:hypothetical protein